MDAAQVQMQLEKSQTQIVNFSVSSSPVLAALEHWTQQEMSLNDQMIQLGVELKFTEKRLGMAISVETFPIFLKLIFLDLNANLLILSFLI